MAGQLWVTNSLGGYMYSDQLSDLLRMNVQPLVKFRQFCDAKDASEKGLNSGEKYHWNVYSDVAQQGTVVAETSTMPETNFTVQQGTLTVTEYGNSVPYTQKLDNLSKHSVTDIINKVLRHDAKKAFDIAAEDQFDLTPLRFVATTATNTGTLYTNGTATGTNNIALGKNHIKVIVDTMKERNIPPYMNDDYFSIGHPSTFRQVKDDLESVHQYVDRGFQMILNGEIGRYEGVRFVEQTNIAKAGFANAKSNWAYFFGEDTVAEAIVIPEEMRGKIPTDFGRSKGIAWYYLGGFGLVHTTALGQAQARILKWDSQG
jgi:N4-gp56 family major capsid protein